MIIHSQQLRSNAKDIGLVKIIPVSDLPFEMIDLIFQYFYNYHNYAYWKEWNQFARVNMKFKTVAYNVSILRIARSEKRYLSLNLTNFLKTNHNIKTVHFDNCIPLSRSCYEAMIAVMQYIGDYMRDTVEEFRITGGMLFENKELITTVEETIPKLKNLRTLDLKFAPIATSLRRIVGQELQEQGSKVDLRNKHHEKGQENEVLPKLTSLSFGYSDEIPNFLWMHNMTKLTSLTLTQIPETMSLSPLQIPPNLTYLCFVRFTAKEINTVLQSATNEFKRLETLVVAYSEFDASDLKILHYCYGTLTRLELDFKEIYTYSSSSIPTVPIAVESMVRLPSLREFKLTIGTRELEWFTSLILIFHSSKYFN